MSSATFNHSPASSLLHCLQHVSNAARSFAEKLFAAQDRQFAALEVRSAAVASDFAKAKSRRQLFDMARQYDNTAPSLAAELRCIAGRD
jgi:HD superfamily phosphohydrolase YqeK